MQRFLITILSLILAMAIPAHAAAMRRSEEQVSLWDNSFTLRSGVGYKDNVLLSRFAARGSWTVNNSLEWMAFRLPVDQYEVYWYTSFDDTRYTDNPGTDKEQVLVSQFSGRVRWNEKWSGGIEGRYLYQDSVFDASIAQTNFSSLKALGHQFSLKPSVRYEVNPKAYAEIEVGLVRQYLDEPLDGYWQLGPAVRLVPWKGTRLQFSLEYSPLLQYYDHREELLKDGSPVTGTHLMFLTHHLEAKGSWKISTNAPLTLTVRSGMDWNRDSGSGYFDYWRNYASPEIRWQPGRWDLRARLSWNLYDYSVQTATAPSTATRSKQTLTTGGRIERKINKHWSVFGDFEYERALGNVTLDEYTASTVSLGLIFEF